MGHRINVAAVCPGGPPHSSLQDREPSEEPAHHHESKIMRDSHSGSRGRGPVWSEAENVKKY